jgi:hypothetical protein
MAKMQRPTSTFSVRFVADDISPQQVPLRAVSDALAAVQDLASGRDPLVMPKVDPEKAINLVDVKHGSAIYSCLSHAPAEAMVNLALAGSLISTAGEVHDDSLIAILKPLQRLSDVAKAVKCRLEVISSEHDAPLLVVEDKSYESVSKRLFVRGDTTVIGKVERAGGATEMRCLLRVPGRRHILYCGVKSKELVQRLGQHLYEHIAAVGTAVWIHRTWYIYEFTINDFSQPRIGNAREAISRLREAGLSGWDGVEDPEAALRDLRS